MFGREGMLSQVLDKAGHNGYQAWHREYDDEIVAWLRTHREVSVNDFLNKLKSVYSTNEMKHRFPNPLEMIKQAIQVATGGSQ